MVGREVMTDRSMMSLCRGARNPDSRNRFPYNPPTCPDC
jgi:hypothetical protein